MHIRLKGMLRGLAVGAASIGATLTMAVPAQADITYESDKCSSGDNEYCFEIYWGSRGEVTGNSYSTCFVANQSIPNHYGRPGGHPSVSYRYVYRAWEVPRPSWCNGGEGSGQGIKNNAASAANNECSARNRIYYNSGYAGDYETYSTGCGSYWPATNLKSSLKNENASHKRL